jgi:hypothetical protein
MEVLFSVLCGLAMVIFVITVVGHLLWLFFAAIVRGMFGADSAQHTPPARPCPACGRIGTVIDGRCRACGSVPAISAPVTLTQELEATARHLERLLRRGIVQPDEYERMMDAIRTDLARLKHPRPPLAAPQPAPAARPLAEASPEGVVEAVVVAGKPPAARSSAAQRPPAPVAQSPFAAADPLAPIRTPGVTHPLDRVEPPQPKAPPQPTVPTRTLVEIVQSFMEERNIRWLEVISGLTIVICSIGLVISLRSTLKAIPYAPALLFMLFTVAFHGAGMYSLRRWNLQVISRTILLISLLLVPLGFSAGIVLGGSGETRREVTDPLFLVALAIGTLAFGWVTVSAARETVGAGWWRLSIAVLGSSLAQVLVSRLARRECRS